MDLALGAAVAIGEQWGVPNLRESQLGDWRLRGKEGANILRPADVKAGRRSVMIPVESVHAEFGFLILRRTFHMATVSGENADERHDASAPPSGE